MSPSEKAARSAVFANDHDRPTVFRARPMLGVFASAASAQRANTNDVKTVLFVCEHDTVKSVLAMAHFERLAREAGLTFRAISRGTAPDATLPAFMRDGLQRAGFDVGAFAPRALANDDLATVALVVSFDVPDVAGRARSPAQQWDSLPSVSANFAQGNEAIRRRVARLVDSLSKRAAEPRRESTPRPRTPRAIAAG